jgi:uncharacterized protein
MMAKAVASCPICGRPSTEAYRPFCTARCKDVDLGRWLTGVYRIPGPQSELEEDLPPSPDAT